MVATVVWHVHLKKVGRFGREIVMTVADVGRLPLVGWLIELSHRRRQRTNAPTDVIEEANPRAEVEHWQQIAEARHIENVWLRQKAEGAIEAAIVLLNQAESPHIQGSGQDAAWKHRRDGIVLACREALRP
jgi:hypothetical protein